MKFAARLLPSPAVGVVAFVFIAWLMLLTPAYVQAQTELQAQVQAQVQAPSTPPAGPTSTPEAGAAAEALALPAAPAATASRPAGRTAFDVVTAHHVALGAPDSPRASIANYFSATRQGRWQDAARYLVLTPEQAERREELARHLKAVIDDTGWVDLESLSDAHDGNLADGLPPDLEDVTRINLKGRSDPLRLVRTADARGSYWAFSPAAVALIDTWYELLPDRWLRDALLKTGLGFMVLPGPLELLWWQWVALGLLMAVAWVLGGLLGRITGWLLMLIAQRRSGPWARKLASSLTGPLTLAWALALLLLGAHNLLLLGPADRLIEGLTTAGIVFVAFWVVWRSTRVAAQVALEKPWASHSPSARTLILVGSNFVLSAIIIIGVLAVLSALGYPVATLLAGLGIGGLALAFGAQKTIENVFGSVSIAIDQPFRVGDFATVDGVTGVVEHIGLRSTRLRTLDRTLVSMPNGKVSDARSESFTARDRFRLATTLGILHGTSRVQIEQVLSGFERVLVAHPRIWPDSLTVRLACIGDSSLDIEIMAWFVVPNWSDFERCRQEVLLDFIQVVEDAGTAFAFPTQTLHLTTTAGEAPRDAELLPKTA